MGKKDASKGSETKKIWKASLTLPFDKELSWPCIEKSENTRIIQEIKQELPQTIIARPSSKVRKSNGRRTPRNDLLLVGVNAVTKALEKGPLLLVLVCKSAKPINMTHHLISLSALRCTPAGCVNGLTTVMSEILGLKSVLAVGFKARPGNPLQDLIDFVKDKIPHLKVPWLSIWKREMKRRGENLSKADGTLVNKGKNSTENYDVVQGVSSDMEISDCNGSFAMNTALELNSEDSVQQSRQPDKQIDKVVDEGDATRTDEGKISSIEGSAKESSLDHLRTGRKRNFDDVAYSLYETNFKFTEVNIKAKKKK